MPKTKSESVKWIPLMGAPNISGSAAPPLYYSKYMLSGQAIHEPQECDLVAQSIGLPKADESFRDDIWVALHQFIVGQAMVEHNPSRKELREVGKRLASKADGLLAEIKSLLKNEGNIGVHAFTTLQNNHGLQNIPELISSLENLSEASSNLVKDIGPLKSDKTHHHILNFLFTLKMIYEKRADEPVNSPSWNTYKDEYDGPFFRFAKACMDLLKPEYQLTNAALGKHIGTIVLRSKELNLFFAKNSRAQT